MTGPTDAERLSRAFRALDAAGVIAREAYGWGRGDGPFTINGERSDFPRARGFVHDAVDRGPGLLFFGAFTDAPRQDPKEQSALGREVVEALRDQGLEPRWDGDPGRAIELAPGAWEWRSPCEPSDGARPALRVNFHDRRPDRGGLGRFPGEGVAGDGVWRELLYRLTPVPGSFMTFIASNSTSVQLVWERGPLPRVEVPDPGERVFRFTHLPLEQVEEVVAALVEDGRQALGDFGDLEVEPWG